MKLRLAVSLVAFGLAACGKPPCQPQKKKGRCRSEAVQEVKKMPEPAKAAAQE